MKPVKPINKSYPAGRGFFCIFIILLLTLTAAAEKTIIPVPADQAEVVARCGRGSLLQSKDQSILLLAGTPYEIGYQQGRLMRKEVKSLMDTVLVVSGAATRAQNKDYDFSLKGAWAATEKYIAPRFREEMRGLADGSKMPLRDIELANIFPELFHCSGFAVFGKATSDGTLYHGRILDYMTGIGLQEHAVVTVVKPDEYNAFVTVGYAGFIGSVTGMNEKKVAIGEMGGRGEGKWDGVPMTFLLRAALEESVTIEQAVAAFRDRPRTCEYYYVISDPKIPSAAGLACTSEMFASVGPGQTHDLLPYAVEDAVLLSAGDRYEKLTEWVKRDYGQIDLQKALQLMNRPVAMSCALHNVLFQPASLKLWVANATAGDGDENCAANQPYYEYDMKELLELISDTKPENALQIPPESEYEKNRIIKPNFGDKTRRFFKGLGLLIKQI